MNLRNAMERLLVLLKPVERLNWSSIKEGWWLRFQRGFFSAVNVHCTKQCMQAEGELLLSADIWVCAQGSWISDFLTPIQDNSFEMPLIFPVSCVVQTKGNNLSQIFFPGVNFVFCAVVQKSSEKNEWEYLSVWVEQVLCWVWGGGGRGCDKFYFT